MRTIVWFRGKDLRLSDHAPLLDAVSDGETIPLFVLDPYFFAPARARELPHRIQFLLDSLVELATSLRERGSRLVLVEGKSTEIVPRLVLHWKADRVRAHRWVEPFGRERDRRVRAAIGSKLELYEGETLWPPGSLRTSEGRPYSVFTPFAAAFRRTAVIGRPLPAPRKLPPLPRDVAADGIAVPSLESLGLVRRGAILAGGEHAARERLRHFLRTG